MRPSPPWRSWRRNNKQPVTSVFRRCHRLFFARKSQIPIIFVADMIKWPFARRQEAALKHKKTHP